MKNSFKLSYQELNFNKKVLFLLIVIFILTAFYPSDTEYYKARERNTSSYVYFVEDGLRYTNTVLQAMIPLLLADKIGVIQAVYIGMGTFVSVHTVKRLLNNVTIGGTRLGERPRGSKHNVPSGHSAMATSAMAFVIIRYGWAYAFWLIPISILTMIVRLLLKAHTLSAVLSGAILGITIGLIFTSKYTGNSKMKFSNIFSFFSKKI